MRDLLKKEFRSYFLLIVLLLIVNLAFLLVSIRAASCNVYNMASECLVECGAGWTLADYIFYCACSCDSGLGVTALM